MTGAPDPVPVEPAGGGVAPDADETPRSRRRGTPVVRWIRGLSQAAYAGMLLAAIVVLLLVVVLVNPGDRVGPVRPASPPVGGPGLPATRL